MRIIDADAVVTVQVFDEMYEEYNLKTMTIAEALDLWTEEGCPSSADTVSREQYDYVCKEYNKLVHISEDYTRLLGADMGEPSEIPDEPETCGNCNHSSRDFGIWICSEETSRRYDREVELDEEGCELWESDSE